MWGIKAYVCPKDEYARLPIPNVSMNKIEKKTYIDYHTKAKSIVPSPDKYNKIHAWC